MKIPTSWSLAESHMAVAYLDELKKLTENSKPVINDLTERANRYRQKHPNVIVYLIEERIQKVSGDLKLAVLYLMDSIIKNHPHPYKELFSVNIAASFSHVFRYSNEKWRIALYKLRYTWSDILSPAIRHDLDKALRMLDPSWKNEADLMELKKQKLEMDLEKIKQAIKEQEQARQVAEPVMPNCVGDQTSVM